jgi:hypothetical protein
MLYPTELQARGGIIATYRTGGNFGGRECARDCAREPAADVLKLGEAGDGPGVEHDRSPVPGHLHGDALGRPDDDHVAGCVSGRVETLPGCQRRRVEKGGDQAVIPRTPRDQHCGGAKDDQTRQRDPGHDLDYPLHGDDPAIVRPAPRYVVRHRTRDHLTFPDASR